MSNPFRLEMRSAVLVISGVLLFIVGCGTEQSQPDSSAGEFKKLEWVAGVWRNEAPNGVTREVWTKVGEGLITGQSHTVSNGDTTFTEELRIEQIDGEIYYIPTVAHNEGPVRFKLIQISENSATFENPEHDFPTRIIYRKIAGDSLHARIEGIRKGKETGVDFVYAREKN